MGTGRAQSLSMARVACLLLALLLITPDPGPARNIETSSFLLEIPRLAQLDISGDVSGLLSLNVGAGASAYDAGFVESAADAVVLTINTNDAWDLSARLAGAWVCPGAYEKPETDLMVRISNSPTGTIENGASGYITLDTVDTMILSHDSSVSDNEVHIQSRVLLSWEDDIPGTYEITVTYTLVTHVP